MDTTLQRKAELARIHIAKKRLGLTDDLYRAIIARVAAGKTSARDLDFRERGKLLDEMNRWSETKRAHQRNEAERAGESASCVQDNDSATCVQTPGKPASRTKESATCVQIEDPADMRTHLRTARDLNDVPAARQIGKIRALWIALARAGALRDSSETALRHFVKRVSGQDALAWLGAADANKVIEALKAMMRRAH